MEALVGVKSLFTMFARFSNFFFLYGGLSFEKLADSHSLRPFLWSSRPHSPPVGDSNRIRCAEACQGWTFLSRCPPAASSPRRPHQRVRGPHHRRQLAPRALPVRCDPASVEKSDDGRLARPLCVFEAPHDKLVPCGPCSGSTQQSERQSLPLDPPRRVGIQRAMRGRRWRGCPGCSAALLVASTRDSDERLRPGRPPGKPASGSTPDGPGAMEPV